MKYTVDLQKIANELDFDLEDIKILLEVFLNSAKNSLNKMEKAIKANNNEDIFYCAHDIKGSSLNLRLTNISNLSKEIETIAKNNENIDYQSKYENLKQIITNITWESS